ncbi:MAG: alpha-galactosidase [Parvularculaceae bacterium]
MSGDKTGAARFLALHGRTTSLILETPVGKAPLWRYWGPRLPDDASPPCGLRDERPSPSFSLDRDLPLSVFPAFGGGWFYTAALKAHRNGEAFAQAFTGSRVKTVEGRLTITLEDPVSGVEVEIQMRLDGASDVLTISTALTNRGADALDVIDLAAAALVLPAAPARVRYFTGRHNREFDEREELLGAAAWRRENRRGLASHDAFPGALVLMGGAGRDDGLVYGVQIAWSGNHFQSIERIDDGRRLWLAGEGLAPGEGRLAPGETMMTPDVLATCSDKGANGVAQNFHRAIRARMEWPGGAMAPRPVHLNTWEAFYFNHRLDELKSLADEAARLGVERFVLDDGWFKGRDNDRSGLGDWTPDPVKYPQGLRPLADHVIALGMAFGLWVEPEMVNPDSDLFRAHPDWALLIRGHPLLTGRNQLVLDLTREDVSDHLFAAIGALLAALPISYVKWDHNRDLAFAGDVEGRAAYGRQVRAAYALMARLRRAYPAVEIEACAGGGGRSDAGVLQHAHRIWASDCLDAPVRLSIQRGFLQFLPPEVMGSHIGAAPAHSTGRTHAMELRAGVAATGHLGLELDIRSLDANDRLTIGSWIEFYKRSRGLIHSGAIWIGDEIDGLLWQAHGAPEDFILFVLRVDPTRERFAPTIRLAMADPVRRYRVRIEQGWQRRGWVMGGDFFNRLSDDGAEISGAWLNRSGLPMPPMLADSAVVFRLTAQ